MDHRGVALHSVAAAEGERKIHKRLALSAIYEEYLLVSSNVIDLF